MVALNQPEKRIAPEAVKVWRISNSLTHIIILFIGSGLVAAGIYFNWLNWILIVLGILLALDVVMAVWDIFFEPVLTERYWRYDISEEFVQIKHGIFKVHQTVAPMTKVQYVTANQGPLLRRYQLQSLEIGTMNTSVTIPALPEKEALALRAQIAEYAKIKEVEEI